ncbi:MAG: phosphatase PAP2-related protein [Ignavibacteriaceae bacterium]
MNWGTFLKNKYYRNEFIISILILAIVLFVFANFLNFNEGRNGITLADPLLHFYKAVNLTWLTFSLIYFSILIILFTLVANPRKLLLTIQCYSLLLLIRIILMFLMPLNPPVGMILLNDPFVQLFGTGQILTKDLFFSGHTATIFLFYLVSGKRVYRTYFLLATVLVGASVLLQHVHYSIDVLSAPFFSYASYRLVYLMQTKKLKVSLIE